jgi:hypothetical protein
MPPKITLKRPLPLPSPQDSTDVKEPSAKRVCRDDKEEKKDEQINEKAKALDVRDPDLLVSSSSSSSEIKNLTCTICMMLMEDAHSFPCGHCFCKGKWVLSNSLSLSFRDLPLHLDLSSTGCSSQLKPRNCPIDRTPSKKALIAAPYITLQISGNDPSLFLSRSPSRRCCFALRFTLPLP